MPDPDVLHYIAPQAVEQMENINTPQPGEQITQQAVEQKENAITPQLGEQIRNDIFSIGWGHHKVLIDKYSKQPEKALFFVHQTVENGWSRDMLLNFMGNNLYERQGKALTNFQRTLPEETSDLARELTKDPYDLVLESLATNYIGWPTSRFVYVYKGTTFFVRFQISGIDLGRFSAPNGLFHGRQVMDIR